LDVNKKFFIQDFSSNESFALESLSKLKNV